MASSAAPAAGKKTTGLGITLPRNEVAPGSSFSANLEAFSVNLNLFSMLVPAKECQRCMKTLEACLLNVPKVPNIHSVKDGDGKPRSDKKVVVLHPRFSSLEDLPEDTRAFLTEIAAEPTTFPLRLSHEHFSAEEILKSALPEDMTEITCAFETIGHIAHMNLRDHHLPYKNFIGEVILEKNKNIRTVVNKLSTIDNTFRFFHMEVLAGEPTFKTEVRENDCKFRFDFSKVYWNSRLHHEHERLVNKFTEDDVICDMMAGVGPFALPAAKRGCYVYANDLNPESYAALKENLHANKVERTLMPFNMDGRDFVRHVVAQTAVNYNAQQASAHPEKKVYNWPPFTQVIMNLPASALEFLDVFRGLYHEESRRVLPLPTINCHCFTRAEDYRTDVIQRAEGFLGGKLEEPIEVHDIRDVAPNKRMMCISFKLPAAIAYAAPSDAASPAAKRPALEHEDDQ